MLPPSRRAAQATALWSVAAPRPEFPRLQEPAEGPDKGEEPVGRPWWSYAIPYFGRAPELSRGQWRVLGLLVIAELFEHYDVGLLSLALSQIQLGLGVPEDEIAALMGVVRLGALPAIAVGVLADRFGRRQLLLYTILGSAVFTFLSGVAQDAAQFQFFQFFARLFLYSEPLLASVVLVEELKAKDRGFGIGLLGALGSLGHALGAILFSQIDVLPHGWRDLYIIGAVPLLAVAWFRRSLPESRRFVEGSAALQTTRWWQPLVSVARQYPGRLAAITAAYASIEFVQTTATMFGPKYLQEVQGWEPGQVGGLYLVGGALAIMGHMYAGVLSDRFGRRVIMTVFVGVLGIGYYTLYNSSGFAIPVAWVLTMFSAMGLGVLFKTVGAELFPTSYRSAATMVRAGLGVAAGSLGLFLASSLYDVFGSHQAVITNMLPLLVVAPIILWFAVPETAGRELEDIAPERS